MRKVDVIAAFNIFARGAGGFLILYEDELMRLPHSRYLSDGGGGFVNPL